MTALILAMALLQGNTQASFGVTTTVVRRSCIVIGDAGGARWENIRRSGAELASGVCTTVPAVSPPRVVTGTGSVGGQVVQVIEVMF